MWFFFPGGKIRASGAAFVCEVACRRRANGFQGAGCRAAGRSGCRRHTARDRRSRAARRPRGRACLMPSFGSPKLMDYLYGREFQPLHNGGRIFGTRRLYPPRGRRTAFRPRRTPLRAGTPQPPPRTGRAGRFPLRARRRRGRGACRGLRLCRRVRRRLYLDVRRCAVAGDDRGDVRRRGPACSRRTARNLLPHRCRLRAAGPQAGRTHAGRGLRTPAGPLCRLAAATLRGPDGALSRRVAARSPAGTGLLSGRASRDVEPHPPPCPLIS